MKVNIGGVYTYYRINFPYPSWVGEEFIKALPPIGRRGFFASRKELTMRIVKEFLVSAAFLIAIFAAAIQQFAPDAWAQILNLLKI